MIKKSILRGLIVTALTVTVFSSGLVVPTNAAVYEVELTEADTRASSLVWYYKTVNGKTYRRLYDETYQKWLTDWILCE